MIEIHLSGFIPVKPANWPGDLTIRAAPGHTPMLNAKAGTGMEPFWACAGDVLFEGISIRYEITKSTPPPFLVANGSSLTLRYSRLIMTQMQPEILDGTPTRAMFDISKLNDVVVEKCTIIGSEMSFLVLRSQPTEFDRKITLRENLAYCRSLVHLEIAGGPESKIEVIAEDNISRCTNNFVVGGKTPTSSDRIIPLHFSAQRNSFEAKYGLFFASAGVLDQFGENVRWQGNQNFYRNERLLTSLKISRRAGFSTTLSQWRDFAQSTEKESTSNRKYIFRFIDRVAQNKELSPLLANPSVIKNPRLYMKIDIEKVGPSAWSKNQREGSDDQ